MLFGPAPQDAQQSLQISMGLIARLMPQLMIFFIAVPVQIMLGFVVLSIVLSAILMLWLGAFQEGLSSFMPV